MNDTQWTKIDNYFDHLLITQDPLLESVLQKAEEAQLPPIAVSPLQGKFLSMMVGLHGAKTILEIGTLAGYSTIWMARALPQDGKLITLETNETFAQIAQSNITDAGLNHIVDVRLGAALDTLPKLEKENVGPFDFIFIDADKTNNPNYFQWSLKLSHPGTVIICDNVVRNGEVLDAASDDENVQGIRAFNNMVSAEPRVEATTLQTVGAKGYDGFMLILVKSL